MGYFASFKTRNSHGGGFVRKYGQKVQQLQSEPSLKEGGIKETAPFLAGVAILPPLMCVLKGGGPPPPAARDIQPSYRLYDWLRRIVLKIRKNHGRRIAVCGGRQLSP